MANLIRPSKTLLALALTWVCSTSLFAQDPVISMIEKANSENPQNRIQYQGSRLLSLPQPKSFPGMPSSKLENLPKSFYQAQSKTQSVQNANCVDSSFFKVFEAADRAYSFYCSAKTKDGGIVLGGYGRNKLVGPPYTWYSVVTKFDSAGHHIWSRELRSEVIPGQGLYIESMSVLADGSILAMGEHDNPLSTSPPNVNQDFFIAKLTSSGDLLWLKTFHATLADNCSLSDIRYVSLAEGANGELYLAGTVPNCTIPLQLIVLKLNSTGDLLWDYHYTDPSLGSYCMGIFFEGGYITVVCRTPGISEGSVRVHFLRLNSATGNYILHKSWIPDLPYPANFNAGFLNWTPQVIKLDNGNYCVYGHTFGDYNISPTDVPHFSVVEFNGNYDYVKGYTIHSSLVVNLYLSKIEVDRFGRVVYSMTDYADPLNITKYIGAADNGVIVHQRKRQIQNLEHFYDNLELFDDGSYVYISDLATIGQDNFYLHYSLMHNTDTSSQCLGVFDNFSYTSPINYIPDNFIWPPANANTVISTNNQNNMVLPIIYTESAPCSEKAFCDTLKIHGNATACNFQQDFSFSAFKNIQCGSRVNWFIDPAVVLSSQIVNDTTLQLRLNQPWQGWLYAEIITSCGKLRDSLFLTITDSPGQVNIGPDTTICPSNTIVLNAHRGYATYHWNNGSADSLLSITIPGIYYVDVTDACGNFSSDTVVVSPAAPVPFDVGPDRTKCNNDTLHLNAPGGFLNYQWGPAYNINPQTGQQVIVQPAIDTSYFVRAEKTQGCFAYDTVKIKVNTSPLILLGQDKSFCQGDSAILNAGSGFTQYQWSNGSSSEQIAVHLTGNYSVIGTTTEGCKSFDTLRIVNVWPNPVVTLDDNPELCVGDSRVLNAGNFNSYQWQNGSTASTFVVTGTGTYYVTVQDNNQCKGSDTVRINSLLPLPANFLPADTAICNYGNLLIKPSASFTTYSWSNNAVSSSISVTAPGIYWLQVTDASKCAGRDSILVKPKECLKGFYIPSAFTPDGDGRNDDFKPFIGGVVKQYQFTIYNRWGQVVFITKDLYRGWDGNFSGTQQDTNTFVWMCTYQLEGESVKLERGTVLLIR